MENYVFLVIAKIYTEDHHEPFITQICGVYNSLELAKKHKKRAVKLATRLLFGKDNNHTNEFDEVTIESHLINDS